MGHLDFSKSLGIRCTHILGFRWVVLIFLQTESVIVEQVGFFLVEIGRRLLHPEFLVVLARSEPDKHGTDREGKNEASYPGHLLSSFLFGNCPIWSRSASEPSAGRVVAAQLLQQERLAPAQSISYSPVCWAPVLRTPYRHRRPPSLGRLLSRDCRDRSMPPPNQDRVESPSDIPPRRRQPGLSTRARFPD